MFNKVKSYRQKRIKISRIYKRKDFKLSALIKAYSNLKIRYYLNYKKSIKNILLFQYEEYNVPLCSTTQKRI